MVYCIAVELLEHGCGVACREHAKTTRQEFLWPHFLQNTDFLKCIFVLLPSVGDRSVFTSNYSLLLTVVIQLNVSLILYMPLWKNMFCYGWLITVIVYSLNSWELYWCLRLWITLAIGWDFCLAHLSVPFSQVLL